MSGHILRLIDSSQDYVFSRMFVSKKMSEEMCFHAFSHDVEKFHYEPVCLLTDEATKRVGALDGIFAVIIGHSEVDLPLS